MDGSPGRVEYRAPNGANKRKTGKGWNQMQVWTDAKVELKEADSLFDSRTEIKHKGSDLHALKR